MVRRNDANRHDMVSRGDHGCAGHGHHGIEVACRQGVREIPDVVGKERMNQSKVCSVPGLEKVALDIDFEFPLALFHNRTDTRRRENTAEPGAVSAYPLDECTL